MLDWREVTNDTKLRVAFYGRVSTEHEMQVSALKNQIQWYEELAERNPNWEIIGSVTSYLDRGITGTQAKKRPNFLRLIEDAMTGKIDMIVTREVSRDLLSGSWYYGYAGQKAPELSQADRGCNDRQDRHDRDQRS